MLIDGDINKKFKIIKNSINKFDLDLNGLTIFTELGTNDYMYTPIIASLANAKKVYARVKDSRYGSVETLTAKFKEIQLNYDFPGVIEIVENDNDLKNADIITNSGFIRPIDRIKIDLMKETAVIPLMWETWEFRNNEVDFLYARKKNKLILGTYEDFLYNNNGFLVTKLLYEIGLGVYKDNILVISSGRIGKSISNFFENTNVTHDRIVFDENFTKKESKFIISSDKAIDKLKEYDAIIIAEHYNNIDLISNLGIISCDNIKNINPSIKIVHICGNITKEDINKAGLSLYPEKIASFGHMSVGAAYLDSHAVLELNTAGLRVGEVMARNRLENSLEISYYNSIKEKIVHDFSSGYLNYIPKDY